jgi:hypothetical protein
MGAAPPVHNPLSTRTHMIRFVFASLALALAAPLTAAEPNTWVKIDGGAIEGRRWDVPLGYAPELKRFLVMGGRITFADVKKPRHYDVLSITPDKTAKWRNELPEFGAKWGAETGPITVPAWKDEVWGFTDTEGNTRPNWSVYGTFSLGGKYDYDPESKCFHFLAGNNTFKYNPKAREWTNLRRRAGPDGLLGGTLLWSSMAYDRELSAFVLFGGGNVQTQRGDPGTWTFDPTPRLWKKLDTELQPPARANARLVYDPVNKLTVLFGGDQLDALVADTWIYNSAKTGWIQVNPPVSPSPRAGHTMLWLPKSKRVLLLGGYTYSSTTDYVAPLYKALPLEAWTYDPAKSEWALLGRWETDAPTGPANAFLSAAVDENDTVLLLDAKNQAWFCSFDGVKPDAAGTQKHGALLGAMVHRTGSHDPKWYTEGVPAADPKQVAERLKELKPNTWALQPTPKRPGMNMDWGSAVFDTANDKIVRFSGGHSAYCGTAPVVYDVSTDRYSLPFAPEYPIEYVYHNNVVRGEWSFKGNPWMTGHTYKTTGYDPNLKCLVFVAHDYTHFFDASTGKWSRSEEKNPFVADMYTSTVCTTPEGAVTWANVRGSGEGIFRLDAETRTWKPLPKKDKSSTFPQKSPDHHGLSYDSKRDRLLFFSDLGVKKGHVAAYDFKTEQVSWLEPAGAGKALVSCRETVYVPDADVVLVGARVTDADGALVWLAYDCAKNAWVGVPCAGEDPIGKKGAFNNSVGLVYDPERKLVWAVGQYSQVHALKLDVSQAKPLK